MYNYYAFLFYKCLYFSANNLLSGLIDLSIMHITRAFLYFDIMSTIIIRFSRSGRVTLSFDEFDPFGDAVFDLRGNTYVSFEKCSAARSSVSLTSGMLIAQGNIECECNGLSPWEWQHSGGLSCVRRF